MAKNVVGLNDNNVLSALYVYDSNISKAQAEINADNVTNFENINTNITNIKNLMNEHLYSQYWKNHQGTNLGVYFYEGANTTTYSLPNNCAVVFVYKFKGGNNRGVAWAIQWNNSNPRLWTCSLHDDTGSNKWGSWVEK